MSNWKFKDILNNIELIASIDTLSIASPQFSKVHRQSNNYLYLNSEVKITYVKNKETEKTSREYIYRLNPNKVFKLDDKNYKLVTKYSEFLTAFDYMIEEMGLLTYRYIRVDFNVDSYKNTYEELLKLNKCFLLLFIKSSTTNCYQSIHPLTLTKLTTRVQRPCLQIENYNKKAQEPSGTVLNRLELRSLKLKNKNENIIPVLVDSWNRRFERVKIKFDALQGMSNQFLWQEWIECKGKYTIIEFVKIHENQIFTRNQMRKLYELLKHKSPKSGADSYCKRFSPVFFTKNDIENYINLINLAFQKFLKS